MIPTFLIGSRQRREPPTKQDDDIALMVILISVFTAGFYAVLFS